MAVRRAAAGDEKKFYQAPGVDYALFRAARGADNEMLGPAELVWLLAASAKGDLEAFERLYLATRSRLYGVLLRMVRRSDLADEILQESYVIVWRNAGEFSPRAATPSPWMVAIARSGAFDLLRKQSEASIEHEPKAIEVPGEGADRFARREVTDPLRQLLACMGTLEEEHRRVLLLGYYNGWSREQLAKKFGKPVDAIKVWLRRGLIEIRECMGPSGEADDDKDVLAAEYALGTLDTDDRANAQMLMAIDPAFAGTIAHWEQRLGPLHALVDPVDPPKSSWDWIKARLAAVEQRHEVWLPGLDEAAALAPPRTQARPQPASLAVPTFDPTPAAVETARVPPPGEKATMPAGQRGWKAIALAAVTLAAAVAGLAVLREARPEILPAALRPAPQVVEKVVEKVVEVVREVPSQRIAEFVAVFQKEDAAPQFVLAVDIEHRVVSVRRVNAEQPADKSYEVWIVTPQAARPRSLGLLESGTFTVRRALADYDALTLHNSTFAISLEPSGGSPTGQPTGPLLQGKLIQTTPPAFPDGTP